MGMDTVPPQHTTPPRYALREPGPSDAPALHALWAASQDADNPALRPHTGWWSLDAWATTARLLLADGEPIGVAALDAAAGDAAVARLALVPAYRQPAAAGLLVAATLDLARAAGVARVRLDIPAAALWASEQARARGFRPIRAVHVMLLPADAPLPTARAVMGAHLRPLRPDEEPALLAALNRAWAGTWNFRPLTLGTILFDLAGQRAGVLVAGDDADDAHIVGTVHAVFDGAAHNPDGGPHAWISNLTTDPSWRGRGLGRALLAAGVAHLRRAGASSVALGVDDADLAPIALYRSAGFATIDTVDTWEPDAPDAPDGADAATRAT